MLELPSASASAPAPNQATGAAIRHVDRQDAGFQGRLREVLGSLDVQQQAGMNQAEAKRAQLPETAKDVEEGLLAPAMPAVDGPIAAEGQLSEFTLADALPAALAQAMDTAAGSPTALVALQDSTTAKSEAPVNAEAQGKLEAPVNAEALVNAAMSSNPTLLPAAIVGSSFGGIASIPDTMSPQAPQILSLEAGLIGDGQTHTGIAGSASMTAGAMPVSAQMPSAAALKDGKAPIADQFTAQTTTMPASAALAEAPTPQPTGQKLNADPTPIMDQVPPGQPDMMVADAQTLAAANQQRGPAAVAQPAGQAAPAQPLVQSSDPSLGTPEQQAIIATLAAGSGQAAVAQPAGQAAPAQPLVQSSDPSLGTPEQQAIIATLAAGSGQAAAAAAQAGKPIQPAQTAPKANILTPVEAAEAAKAGLPSALLAQSLGAGDAAEEANPILLGEAAEAGLGSVELGRAKNVIAKHVVGNESHIIPGQGFGLAIQDGTFPRADAPMQSAAARELPAPPPPVRQLAPVLVSLALGGGNEALTITLDPGELGRVEVSIGQGKDAGQVRIIAERPETLALLQRDQRELDRALNQAGLGDMARSLSFSLASDQGRQQHQHAAQDGAHRFAALTSGQEAERALIPPMPAPPRASTSLIDLAV
jgi:Meckel syndrome type 1 protein